MGPLALEPQKFTDQVFEMGLAHSIECMSICWFQLAQCIQRHQVTLTGSGYVPRSTRRHRFASNRHQRLAPASIRVPEPAARNPLSSIWKPPSNRYVNNITADHPLQLQLHPPSSIFIVAMCSADIFLAIIAFLFPPLPVWVKRGICGADSLINILLCVLGYIPGLLHSWYIIAKFPEPAYEYEALPQDREGGRVTYVYVQCPQGQQQHQQHQQHSQQPKLQSPHGMNYGTQSAEAANPAPPPQEHGITNAGEGSSDHQGVPPSYAEVVAGDNKIQSQD
ncbi:hypothetical protein G7Z17_g2842 [Cylindrodendrum hubeiense]|uniref:Stress response RCI peptide n=1 Tax=Cylindrodendrum hubeiense TaxID=595255 RepID=A0A9P5LIQ7_9HYPO|nr:hypothetical protein G7Z17_g2842 [Cylindrodendrum hubeiense]